MVPAIRLETSEGKGCAVSCWEVGCYMTAKGLDAPDLNYCGGRYKHFFTELGWKRVGRGCKNILVENGYVPVKIKTEIPPRKIVYQDKYQLVIRWEAV